MRTVRLELGEDDARSSTTIIIGRERERLSLRLPGVVETVDIEGVDEADVVGGELVIHGLSPGSRVRVVARVAYSTRVHGLARLHDSTDGGQYVVASGALGGAASFLASEGGPDDRLPTVIEVVGAGRIVAATGAAIMSADSSVRRFVSALPLSGHHVGLAAGPWREHVAGDVRVLTRDALHHLAEVDTLLADSARALAWVSAWFGEPPRGGGSRYTQVLLPDVPWEALEHPGCVLVSERLLRNRGEVDRGRRVAVLAHEVAHQWAGNLVSPRRWEDVGVIEGLAELIGQLACEAILGSASLPFLERRRVVVPMMARAATPSGRTAGLAEVAGPVQHAELLRQARAELGPENFRARIRLLCRDRGGQCVTTQEVWSALGMGVRRPQAVALPFVRADRHPAWAWDGLEGLDPATAAVRAREAFREAEPGAERVRAALAAVHDAATPPAVAAGLGAELATIAALLPR